MKREFSMNMLYIAKVLKYIYHVILHLGLILGKRKAKVFFPMLQSPNPEWGEETLSVFK